MPIERIHPLLLGAAESEICRYMLEQIVHSFVALHPDSCRLVEWIRPSIFLFQVCIETASWIQTSQCQGGVGGGARLARSRRSAAVL